MEEIHEGLIINNRYCLKEYKGSGSFGQVWRAYDQLEKREIAIKIYVSLNKQGCQEFLDEYKVAFGIVHKNLLVTEQYDVWQDRPYLTMKYCGKGSVANLVGTLKPSKENELLIWRFVHDVAAGLAYLHNLQPDPIVHQDIKPDNVLIDDEGTFLITDFGISKRVRSTMRQQSKRDIAAGATAYMGPERFEKQPAPILASDIWSLGVSIYELAEGELPFSGMGGIMLKNGAEMPDLEGWSKELNDVMHSCLEKVPWKRAKAHEIVQIAKDALEGKGGERDNYHIASFVDDDNQTICERQIETGSIIIGPIPPAKDGYYFVRWEPKIPDEMPDYDITFKATYESKKTRRTVIFATILMLTILIIGYLYPFSNSGEEEAAEHQSEYLTAVMQMQKLIDDAKSPVDTIQLFDAKELFNQIHELDLKYSVYMPDFYNKSNELGQQLDLKLTTSASAWHEAGRAQWEIRDYSKAKECFILSLKLKYDPDVYEDMIKH